MSWSNPQKCLWVLSVISRAILITVCTRLLCVFQLFARRKMAENGPRCWVGVKVFGNELSAFTCEDLYNQINQLSLSAAELAVRLLKVSQRFPPLSVQPLWGLFFFSNAPSPPLCLPGSGGSTEPQSFADDRGAGFVVAVRSTNQNRHQHDIPAFAASEGQRQLQGHFSLLAHWIH